MKLICTGSRGSDLPTDVLERSGNTSFSKFDVTVDDEYDVWAMALWTYGIGVLIIDDTGKPNWKPLDIFIVSDGRIGANWEFAVTAEREPVLALWGYPTLIADVDHHNDLIERKLSALEAFLNESGAAGDRRLQTP